MGWNSNYFGDWRPYTPVAERRRLAAKEIAKLKQAGRKISPVEIAGRKITTTFWGDSWNQNLESYSDYANRLPRGRTYVRNGSLIDLQIEAGRIRALVSGSEIYRVDIRIKRLAGPRWRDIKGESAGQIDSLIELLQGSISNGVMEIVTRKGSGLFPAPREISLDCSCPDWAAMCKHVAASLYGVGARLDHRPELLFTLRGVDPGEMVAAAIDRPLAARRSRSGRVLEASELSSVFGVDIVDDPNVARTRKKADSGTSGKARGKSAARKTRAKRSGKKPARKGSAKKVGVKKAGAKKATTKKADVERAAAKKSASKQSRARKAASKKSATRKASRKKSTAKRRP